MIKTIIQDIFIFKSYINNYSLESILKVQYELSKKGISIADSSRLPIFEFESYFDLLCKDLKDEAEENKI